MTRDCENDLRFYFIYFSHYLLKQNHRQSFIFKDNPLMPAYESGSKNISPSQPTTKKHEIQSYYFNKHVRCFRISHFKTNSWPKHGITSGVLKIWKSTERREGFIDNDGTTQNEGGKMKNKIFSIHKVSTPSLIFLKIFILTPQPQKTFTWKQFYMDSRIELQVKWRRHIP